MTFPVVTELVPVLEPITSDTFIVADKPLVTAPPVPSRRIVD